VTGEQLRLVVLGIVLAGGGTTGPARSEPEGWRRRAVTALQSHLRELRHDCSTSAQADWMSAACHLIKGTDRLRATLLMAPMACSDPSCRQVTQFAFWEAGDLRIVLIGIVEDGKCTSARGFTVRDLPGPSYLRGPRRAYWEAEEKKGEVSADEAEGQVEMDEINALDADNIKRTGKPAILVEAITDEE